jgi:hypothetical protein
MKNVVLFPAIHREAGCYWHGGKKYPDLTSLQDSLAGLDLVRAHEWQQSREHWLNSQKKRKRGANGGSAA